ncbi:transposase, partial [Micromonospora chersina]|uniref:transposase n=1 Tax=Micromonospora chersina TaxID=47854 RepID=UPI0037A85EBE
KPSISKPSPTSPPSSSATADSQRSPTETPPKAGDGHVERIRLFKLAKASATKSRAQAINQLKAVLVGADPALRDSMTGLSNPKLIRRCADLDPGKPDTPAAAAAYTLRLLARRIIELSREVEDLNQRITEAINAHTPQLLQRYGVGPDTAAALLLAAGDNPQRLTSEASFAALCGVSPIEMSSGKTQRRRLNRGGVEHALARMKCLKSPARLPTPRPHSDPRRLRHRQPPQHHPHRLTTGRLPGNTFTQLQNAP